MWAKFVDRVAPVIPDFQDDLSKLDVLDRLNRAEATIPEKYLVEYGFDKYPVFVLAKSYGD